MVRCRPVSSGIFLALVLIGCSKDNPPSATQAPPPSQAAPAAPASSAAVSAPAPAAAAAPAPPAAAAVIKTGDTNTTGVAAEVTECSRKDGVLSVKVRFHNTSAAQKRLDLIGSRNYEKYYVTAANKKYFILKDSEGTYLTPQADQFGNLGVDLDAGGQYTWWAKFPAPPAEVKEVSLYLANAAPLEDIPISGQ